jgi:hypothetical protein
MIRPYTALHVTPMANVLLGVGTMLKSPRKTMSL